MSGCAIFGTEPAPGRRSAELTSAAPTLGGGKESANQAVAAAYSRRVGETADWLGTAKIALQVNGMITSLAVMLNSCAPDDGSRWRAFTTSLGLMYGRSSWLSDQRP